MTTKSKKESTKRCLNLNKDLPKVKLNLFIIILLLFNKLLFAECAIDKSIKIGLINDNFKDYSYYLKYELDLHQKSNNNFEYEFDIIKDQTFDGYDIIFGEYNKLSNLKKLELDLPDVLNKFYNKNNIFINTNIIPLDLDTILMISKIQNDKIYLEELSEIKSKYKYTLGMSLFDRGIISKFLNYNLPKKNSNKNFIFYENKLKLLSDIFVNVNYNIIFSNYDELYDSYENLENIFTLFDDGILLYRNLDYKSFQLFPKGKYLWNDNDGYYEIVDRNIIPYSFYGFSAYLVKPDSFICHMVTNEARINAFEKFNLGISPLSESEVETIRDKIPINYYNILKQKNKNILSNYFDNNIIDIQKFPEILFNNNILSINDNIDNYLNN